MKSNVAIKSDESLLYICIIAFLSVCLVSQKQNPILNDEKIRRS